MGGCTYATANATTPLSAYQPCKPLFSGTPCASYDGFLTLTTLYSDSTTPFVDPDFQAHLSAVGLGGITAVYSLYVYVIQAVAIPRDISLAFLPGLTLVTYQLQLLECIVADTDTGGCGNALSPPAVPRLLAVPALSKVYRFRELYMQFTAFKDMTSLKGLTCPPPVMNILDNQFLTTLSGLEGVGPWTENADGPSTIAFENNQLSSPSTVAALQTMALCDSNGFSGLFSPLGINIQISNCQDELQVRPICPCHTALGSRLRTFLGHLRDICIFGAYAFG